MKSKSGAISNLQMGGATINQKQAPKAAISKLLMRITTTNQKQATKS